MVDRPWYGKSLPQDFYLIANSGSERKVSTSKNLRERKDVENSDIPEIIERAERLSQQHSEERDRDKERSSIHDVKLVGKDLSIPEKFVEQAIAELREERLNRIQSEQKEHQERQAMHIKMRSGASKSIKVIGFVVSTIFLLRGIQWLWLVLDFTADETSVAEPKVVVEERIIKETILQTVKTVVEEPVVAVTPGIKDEPSNETPRIEDIHDSLELDDSIGDKEQIDKPVLDTIEPTIQVPTEDATVSPQLVKSINGEWILDAYLLYEKEVAMPMEVPIVYEPLELPKTWRFTNGKYKRVMDTDLSFTARYEITTLPSSLRPSVDDEGQWAQLVASNVVSSIPGIRRQNDYFVVLVGADTLTIWYLGPNEYRKRIPSQAERYVRK